MQLYRQLSRDVEVLVVLSRRLKTVDPSRGFVQARDQHCQRSDNFTFDAAFHVSASGVGP